MSVFKKMTVGAAFAGLAIASFDVVGLDVGSAHAQPPTAFDRQQLICDLKMDTLDRLDTIITNLPTNAPPKLVARLQRRFDTLDAWITANCP